MTFVVTEKGKMTMLKYINADEFLKLVISNPKAQTLVELIDEMPSADVVKVIRCKDCKHWVTTPGELIAPYCEKIGIKDDKGYRDFDDFCSYAERKE